MDKTTPIKPSTDEQNNINKNINPFLSIDGFIGVALSLC
jgi:hypothetical protein